MAEDESTLASSVKTLSGPRIESLRRTISPYDLSPSDNSGTVISKPLLKGYNYNEWAGNLRTFLKARKKFGFVDGSIPKPDADSADLEDWWTNNAIVLSVVNLRKTVKKTNSMSFSRD